MARKMCRASHRPRPLPSANKILYMFLYFSQKKRNSLFPQCKTAFKKSGYIQDTAVKFAPSKLFCLVMTNRIFWPPSLSRDRKWSRTQITLWLRATR